MKQLPALTVWQPASGAGSAVHAVVSRLGPEAELRFLEFFTARIRNANTRAAYARDVRHYLSWLEASGLDLATVRPLHVAMWVESMAGRVAVPTVKRRLSAVSHLYDWLVTGQVVAFNPAASVRGPSHSVRKGSTPVLTSAEMRQLLDSLSGSDVVSLRDRALVCLMVYSFARISAALAMNVRDYTPRGRRFWVRLSEKGGKQHELPCHHRLEEALDAYLEAAGLHGDRHGPLFRAVDSGGRSGRLGTRRLDRRSALAMVQRRARQAGILTPVCNHSFRATGITNFLENRGSLEMAQTIANHSSPRTTRLYDRRSDTVALEEIERLRF